MTKNKTETEKEKPAWMNDGKRFACAIQQEGNFGCDYYKDFFDTDIEEEAKQMAINSAKREKCKALIFDRKNGGMVCHRYDFTEPKPPPAPKEDDLRKKKKRGK